MIRLHIAKFMVAILFQALLKQLLRAWADGSPDVRCNLVPEAAPGPGLPLQADGGQDQDGQPRSEDAGAWDGLTDDYELTSSYSVSVTQQLISLSKHGSNSELWFSSS